MKTTLICVSLLIAQAATAQVQSTVRLPPHTTQIPVAFSGRQLELVNSPAVVYLPNTPPMPDAKGKPWIIEIKNAGPDRVSVVCKMKSSLSLEVGQSTTISSDGVRYSIRAYGGSVPQG